MTPEECQMVMDLRDPPTAEDNNWEMVDDALHRNEALGISHEGGKLEAITELDEGIKASVNWIVVRTGPDNF
jgi:hypothetical protein